MDSWYKEGAIVVRKKKTGHLIYSTIGLWSRLSLAEVITIYEISLEQALSEVSIYNRHKGSERKLLGASDVDKQPGKKKEVSDLMTVNSLKLQRRSYIRYVGFLVDFANGRHYVPDYGICYDYKDEIEDFMET